MWFLKFLEESTGMPSQIRLVSFLWAAGILGVWGFLCIRRGEILSIPESVAAVLCLLIGAKVGQKALEK